MQQQDHEGRNQVQPRRPDRERGSMAVEVVLLIPVLISLLLLVVAFGRYVSVRGQVEAATRDAARAASLERDSVSAAAAAQQAATASLPATAVCGPTVVGGFAPGGTVTVDLDCEVSWDGLGLIGLSGTVDVHVGSAAPVDQYRGTS
ncbi:MAG: hypothetical protein QG608_632 [Actinomycetota bacterium]|nr:hypothetical protein [Actinomycetota bacterium]